MNKPTRREFTLSLAVCLVAPSSLVFSQDGYNKDHVRDLGEKIRSYLQELDATSIGVRISQEGAADFLQANNEYFTGINQDTSVLISTIAYANGDLFVNGGLVKKQVDFSELEALSRSKEYGETADLIDKIINDNRKHWRDNPYFWDKKTDGTIDSKYPEDVPYGACIGLLELLEQRLQELIQ